MLSVHANKSGLGDVGSGVGAQAPSTSLMPHVPHAIDPHAVESLIIALAHLVHTVIHAPAAEVLVERRGTDEEIANDHDAMDRPIADVLVERRGCPRTSPYIVVTPEVSHAPMSSLKDDASLNNSDMSVTPDVSHVEMWPYVVSAALASASHAATAVLMLLSVIG